MANDPYTDHQTFLGTQIKRRRDRAGWTQTEFAEKIRFSLDTVKSVETGRLFASEPFAEAADQAFVADGDLIELREYLERASMRPWFRDRMIMEQKAVDIWEYEPYVVSGLLQTESYMRAVASGERPSVPDNEIDERVELRLRRQEILGRDNPPHLWVIIEESALRRTVGGPEVMAEQREHLVEMSKRPNVTIQVIPESQGVTSGIGRAFSVLAFNSNSALVYLEEIGDARYIRDPGRVRPYVLAYEHLRASAWDDNKSAEFIRNG